MGVICLPNFNIIPAVLAMVVDLSLDFILLGRAGFLFRKADEANKGNEGLLMLTSVTLLIWNLVILYA